MLGLAEAAAAGTHRLAPRSCALRLGRPGPSHLPPRSHHCTEAGTDEMVNRTIGYIAASRRTGESVQSLVK